MFLVPQAVVKLEISRSPKLLTNLDLHFQKHMNLVILTKFGKKFM